MRVKDPDGNVLPGLLKTSVGIVVDNNHEYEKYRREQSTALEIKQLKDEMSEIKALLKSLLNK